MPGLKWFPRIVGGVGVAGGLFLMVYVAAGSLPQREGLILALLGEIATFAGLIVLLYSGVVEMRRRK